MDPETSSLLHKALLGLIVGGGTYGGMRLMSDIPKATQKPAPARNELEITLPASRMPKMAATDHSALHDYLLPLLAGGGGATAGFLGASKLYDAYQQHQLKQKEQGVGDEYLKALQQAHQKVGSLKTPHVDSFLEGLLAKTGEELQKTAGIFSNPGIPTEGVGDTISHGVSNFVHGAANTEAGAAGIAAWLIGTLGAGGATYAIANKMDANKKKNNANTTLPNDIRLNVAHY